MLALVKTGTGGDDVELREMPEPSPGPGQVKIRVRAVGVCGTDIHGHPSLKPPVILGHELSGEIVELGPGVRERAVGQRVTSETSAEICGTCRFCRVEDYNLCRNRRGIATKAEGAFAPYFVIREPSTHVLPPHVPHAAGALCEPLACAVHAVVEQGRVSEGEVVLVTGPGPLGLLSVQVAKAFGATVVVSGIGKDEPRLELAQRLGADRTVNVEAESLIEVGLQMTDGYGFDAAVECSGAVPAVHAALAALRVRGRYVQGGILHREVTLDWDDVFFVREITLSGSHTQKPSSWRTALELLEGRRVDLESLVTRQLPLAQWKDGFDMVRQGTAIKVVLLP